MKSYIERVIAEVPLFLSHFSQCLFRPRHFIREYLAGEAKADEVSKGVEFLILSFTISLIIGQVLPEATAPKGLPADDAAFGSVTSTPLFDLFLLFFAAATTFACLRMVGAAGSFFAFFRLFAFFCGTTLVLLVFANALTNIAMVDPVVAKNWIQLEKRTLATKAITEELLCNTDSAGGLIKDTIRTTQLEQQLLQSKVLYEQATARPLFMLGSGLQALVGLMVTGWLAIAWFSYGRQQQLGRGKIVLSGLLSLGLVYGASLLLSLIRVGAEMMTIQRGCVVT